MRDGKCEFIKPRNDSLFFGMCQKGFLCGDWNYPSKFKDCEVRKELRKAVKK